METESVNLAVHYFRRVNRECRPSPGSRWIYCRCFGIDARHCKCCQCHICLQMTLQTQWTWHRSLL